MNPRASNVQKRNCLEASDPTSHIVTDVVVTKSLEYLKALNSQQNDVKVELKHVVAMALA